MNDEIKNQLMKLLSRKFIVAVIIMIAMLMGLPQETMSSLLIIAGTYIGGQTVIDFKHIAKNTEKGPL